jgi:uncharacterized protein
MDVTLVLTHRCNLACIYCYAGEHHRATMDEAVLDRALELLWADDAPVAQLGFFGGEPLLERRLMERAIQRAKADAGRRGKRLLLQLTTNGTAVDRATAAWLTAEGVRVTVSIDGVREAHDLTRPRAGGRSSFGQVATGLRELILAGARPDVLMVITPKTAPFVYQSVEWLWSEGVGRVRANAALGSTWTDADKDELQKELVATGRAELRRRLDGKAGVFEPFEAGMRAAGCAGSAVAQRLGVVVGTRGHLYACAPLVGEDRDDGPESKQRVGHLDDGAQAIVAHAEADRGSCGDGKRCACAAYLETGDPTVAGPNGRWFAAACQSVGAAIASGLAEADKHRADAAAVAKLPRPWVEERKPPPRRRAALLALGLGVGGLAAAGAAASLGLTPLRRSKTGPACDPLAAVPGQMSLPPPPSEPPVATEVPVVPKDPEPQIAGGIGPPEPPPPLEEPPTQTLGGIRFAEPPPPRKVVDEHKIQGKIANPLPPPRREVEIEGDIGDPDPTPEPPAPPPPPTEIKADGELRAPSPPPARR